MNYRAVHSFHAVHDLCMQRLNIPEREEYEKQRHLIHPKSEREMTLKFQRSTMQPQDCPRTLEVRGPRPWFTCTICASYSITELDITICTACNMQMCINTHCNGPKSTFCCDKTSNPHSKLDLYLEV